MFYNDHLVNNKVIRAVLHNYKYSHFCEGVSFSQAFLRLFRSRRTLILKKGTHYYATNKQTKEKEINALIMSTNIQRKNLDVHNLNKVHCARTTRI